VDPEPHMGEGLLKGKFRTQSESDIHRKLQKSVAEGEKYTKTGTSLKREKMLKNFVI
jgi:hypothetical protein